MKRFGKLITACCMLMQIANSEMELNTTCQNETNYKKGKISIAFLLQFHDNKKCKPRNERTTTVKKVGYWVFSVCISYACFLFFTLKW